MTTKETKHTPGAMRAANKICLSINPHPAWEESACIIDKETHAGELLAALQCIVDAYGDACECVDDTKHCPYCIARAAIKSATKE